MTWRGKAVRMFRESCEDVWEKLNLMNGCSQTLPLFFHVLPSPFCSSPVCTCAVSLSLLRDPSLRDPVVRLRWGAKLDWKFFFFMAVDFVREVGENLPVFSVLHCVFFQYRLLSPRSKNCLSNSCDMMQEMIFVCGC